MHSSGTIAHIIHNCTKYNPCSDICNSFNAVALGKYRLNIVMTDRCDIAMHSQQTHQSRLTVGYHARVQPTTQTWADLQIKILFLILDSNPRTNPWMVEAWTLKCVRNFMSKSKSSSLWCFRVGYIGSKQPYLASWFYTVRPMRDIRIIPIIYERSTGLPV